MAGFSASQPRVPPGQPGGGEWGQPRDAAAAKAQQNKNAQQMYHHLLALPPGQRAGYVKGLTTPQLEALSRIAYSHATSDHAVVNARFAVAGEMGRRGKDVKKFGALGGGLPPKAKAAVHKTKVQKAAARQTAKKAPPPPPPPPPHP